MSYVKVEYQMSERHACRLLGLGRSTHRYRARKAERDRELRTRLKELAARRMRFNSLSDARRKIETWRQDYNEQRPHSSLNYLPPAEFAKTTAEMRA